ncbi:DUF1932 domain-containing protein [Bradyrhizobium sp. BR 1432]|uniref:DUF1932 domain-containing protein n=1 Tax=Bradyrhizobium sp. BR 1432 TaxID=3447966 RepID=UPI003EE789A4
MAGETDDDAGNRLRLAFIGFGEAASAFAQGWRGAGVAARIAAYDIKTDAAYAEVRNGKWSDYRRAGVAGRATLADAINGAEAIFSTVIADQALAAATDAATVIRRGALFFDCNSCSPGTKRKSAHLIDKAGGRYVDVAVMAPVHPGLHRTPLIVAGPHGEAGRQVLESLDMVVRLEPGEVGRAAAIKMTRSIMVKGLEALVIECVLAGRKAGVDDLVIASLDASFPGFYWKKRIGHMMERVATHGVRRAAEMREVAVTATELGLPAPMSTAAADWQQRVGDLSVTPADSADYGALTDAILAALGAADVPAER